MDDRPSGLAAPVPAEEPPSRRLAYLGELEKLLSPAAGLQLVDTYARWVFGGTVAVTALGSLYTRQIIGDLNAWGRAATVLGLLILSAAMASAARALAPVLVTYTPGSIDSMEEALGRQFMRRRPWLERAGWSLAAALLLFGLAPMAGAAADASARKPAALRPVNQVALSYRLTQRPAIDARLEVAGAAPFRIVRMTVERADSAAVVLVAEAAAITDSTGKASAALKTDSLPPGSYTFVARYTPFRRDTAGGDTAIVVARRVMRIEPRAAPQQPPSPSRPR